MCNRSGTILDRRTDRIVITISSSACYARWRAIKKSMINASTAVKTFAPPSHGDSNMQRMYANLTWLIITSRPTHFVPYGRVFFPSSVTGSPQRRNYSLPTLPTITAVEAKEAVTLCWYRGARAVQKKTTFTVGDCVVTIVWQVYHNWLLTDNWRQVWQPSPSCDHGPFAMKDPKEILYSF